MGDYFGHWLKVGARAGAKLPQIYYVNWFRQDASGSFLWPGYGENSRVLKWVFERCNGTAKAQETPIGRLPAPSDLDTKGLDIKKEALEQLLNVDVNGWMAEVPLIREHFAKFGTHLPKALVQQVDELEQRLKAVKK
jgi:phosphoenolpyruvate carboxykinase (GTP)